MATFKVHVEGLGYVVGMGAGGLQWGSLDQGHGFQDEDTAKGARDRVAKRHALFAGAEVVRYEAPRVKVASAADVLSLNDGVARLETGMKAQEAIERAAAWWELRGRREMRDLKEHQEKPIAEGGNGGAFASDDPRSENFVPSGLIHSAPWDELDDREKTNVVICWHHFEIVRPALGIEGGYKMGDRGKIQ